MSTVTGQFRKGDIGSLIRVTVRDKSNDTPLDVTGMMSTFKFQKPSGVVIERQAWWTTDGTDGQLEYRTSEGDLDESGPWNGQVLLVTEGGQWHSDLFAFPVGENL